MAVVRPVRGAIAIVGGSEDEDIVTTTEGVFVKGDGTKRNVGVMARSLVGGGAIEVPVGELAHVSDLVRDRLIEDRRYLKGEHRHERNVFTLLLATKPIVAVNPNIYLSSRLETQRKGSVENRTYIRPGCCSPGARQGKEQEGQGDKRKMTEEMTED
jgi:hypothetical protein